MSFIMVFISITLLLVPAYEFLLLTNSEMDIFKMID
jgi:hypothetical protein